MLTNSSCFFFIFSGCDATRKKKTPVHKKVVELAIIDQLELK